MRNPVASGAAWAWLLPVLVLGLACSLWFLPFTLDDPYVSFRYASHLASGSGLVFNPGERVEGYSNLLWTLLLAAVIRAGGDPLLWSKLIGVGLQLLTIAVLWWCVRELLSGMRTSRRLRDVGALLAATAYAVSWYPSLWSVGSLETPLFTALLLLAFAAVLRDRVVAAALLLLLAALTRPEGVLFFAVFLCVLVLGHLRSHRRLPAPRLLARWTAPFAVPYATFIAWRLAYYGSPLPNTYYDKSGGALGLTLRGGVGYLASFVTTSFGGGPAIPTEPGVRVSQVVGVAAILAAALALLVWRMVCRGRLPLGLATAWVGITFTAILLEGGDWMPGFRFAIPAYPFLVLLAAVGFALVLRRLPARPRALRPATVPCAVAVLALISGMQMRTVEEQVPWLRPIVQVGRVTPEASYRAVASWLQEHVAAGSLVAIEEAGLIPYYADDLRYLDLFGLTDARLARAPGQPPFGKEDNAYVLGRRPDCVLLWEDVHADGALFAPHATLLRDPTFAQRYRLLLTLPRGPADQRGTRSRFLVYGRKDFTPVSRG